MFWKSAIVVKENTFNLKVLETCLADFKMKLHVYEQKRYLYRHSDGREAVYKK